MTERWCPAVNLFQPRYKRYANWIDVLWCRLRGHPEKFGRFYSGPVTRCINCGDSV